MPPFLPYKERYVSSKYFFDQRSLEVYFFSEYFWWGLDSVLLIFVALSIRRIEVILSLSKAGNLLMGTPWRDSPLESIYKGNLGLRTEWIRAITKFTMPAGDLYT